MERGKLLGVAAIIIILVVGFIEIYLPAISFQFSYEGELKFSDPEDIRVSFSDLEDTNITISFVDDPTLWYRMNLTLYERGRSPEVRTASYYDHLELSMEDPAARIQDIKLLLGTSAYYKITIVGQNLNVNITHDNSARLEGQTITCSATGIFRYKLTENVNFTDKGLRVQTLTDPDLVILDIDLPDGLNGDLIARNATFIINEWPYVNPDYTYYYTAPPSPLPLLRLDVEDSPVVASLRL